MNSIRISRENVPELYDIPDYYSGISVAVKFRKSNIILRVYDDEIEIPEKFVKFVNYFDYNEKFVVSSSGFVHF